MRRTLLVFFDILDGLFDRAFAPSTHPFYLLGSLGWFFFWITIASGIYLFVFFDTGITEAYASVEAITHEQWYAGGIMRSLHRYASDALVVVVTLHLLREYALGRFRGARWFSWVSGVPLLWFLFVCGITGYWMVWDKLAQYIALTTAEWLDALPFFGEPIARNFISPATLSGRFFTLMIFIHIALPLVMLLMMWVHIQRLAYAKVNPSKGLALGTMAALLVLSLAKPAVSQGPADLSQVPDVIQLDWFYLALYPLLDKVPGMWLWMGLVALTGFLVAVPWLFRGGIEAPAVVSLENCNGCGRCVQDCPYNAVNLQPRTDGAPFSQEAVVSPELCVSCGICTGACPTSTPFRRTQALIPGIDLPALPIRRLREKTIEASRRLAGDGRIIVYGCAYGPDPASLESPGVAALKLPCIGMLPPSFLDFVITRNLADGVFLTGCREGHCFHRLGIDWTKARIRGERDPYLRKRVPRERIAWFWAGKRGLKGALQALSAFRMRLKGTPPGRSQAQGSKILKGVGQLAAYAFLAALIGYFSTSPAYTHLVPDRALITLSFSHAGQHKEECRRLTPEEIAKLPPNMRRPLDCPRGRVPLLVELALDGQVIYHALIPPSGLAGDGPSTVYQRFPVETGRHRIAIRMRDSDRPEGFDHEATFDIELKPRQHFVIDFRNRRFVPL